MGIELLPDGKTFKKLNAAQTKALTNYYKRAHDKPITQDLALPLSLVLVSGIGLLGYVFKDELKKWLEDKEENVVDWIKGLPVASGGLVADAITDLGDKIFPANPATPEFMTFPDREPIGPLTRCERWKNDAMDWKVKTTSGDFNTIQAALAAKRIISNMKKEGSDRPLVFSVAQWED